MSHVTSQEDTSQDAGAEAREFAVHEVGAHELGMREEEDENVTMFPLMSQVHECLLRHVTHVCLS